MNSNFHPIRAAFTLIELMVSIFLLLIIMVGVNTVFKTTSDTVGAGQAQSLNSRDSRAIQATLNRDFGAMASDGASIIIRDEQLYAYTNQKDYQTDPTNTVPSSYDPTNSGTETLNPVNVTDYGTRSHRLDRISFFTRQLMHRQTGNDGTFIANQAAEEQWVWYGHLLLPDNTPNPVNFLSPGATTSLQKLPSENPNNFYANQWMLGRQSMLLVTPDATTAQINDSSSAPVSQAYIQRDAAAGPAGPLTPLAFNSTTKNGTAAFLQSSRYDLAGTSITAFSTILSAYLTTNANYTFWVDMMGDAAHRFQAMPYVTRPMASADVAKMAPIMRVGVSQFTVEFAGDFVAQTDDNSVNAGTPTGCYFDPVTPSTLNPTGQDGKIDFVVTTPTTNPIRSIRWYGFPRSTSNKTTINVTNGDVCPLRDTIRLAPGYGAVNAPIEKTAADAVAANKNILVSVPIPSADYTTAMNANTSGNFYTVAWGPSDTVRPKLYRITMTLEDPTGHLPAGQTFEYVYAAP